MLEEHSLDSFLLSRRRDLDGDSSHRSQIDSKTRGGKTQKSTGTKSSGENSGRGQKYKYMLFVWNGKKSGATVKA